MPFLFTSILIFIVFRYATGKAGKRSWGRSLALGAVIGLIINIFKKR
jgi:hypothetical protein